MKDHDLWTDELFGIEPPCITYELRPLIDPTTDKSVEGLHSAWITLNNPAQLNSYTTQMVKGVIAGFSRASMDRSVVTVIFTGAGDRAFCTGGNTKEYAEYYSGKPNEYGLYMDLFNAMVDAILNCKKPVICRTSGMRVAGGQEIGMATDITISADTAIYGQAGPRHGSAPDGGSTDFLPWMLSIEDATWNCISCELWSAYKMKQLGMISKVVPVLKKGGEFIRNPTVHTDKYIQDGEIIYGEFLVGQALKDASGRDNQHKIYLLTKNIKILGDNFSQMNKIIKVIYTECYNPRSFFYETQNTKKPAERKLRKIIISEILLDRKIKFFILQKIIDDTNFNSTLNELRFWHEKREETDQFNMNEIRAFYKAFENLEYLPTKLPDYF